MAAVQKAVPSAVPFSASDSVKVDQDPQLGPRTAPTGSSIIPSVPRSDELNGGNVTGQPRYGHAVTATDDSGTGTGAPSVPAMNGVLFTPGPIDLHYQDQDQASDPYRKVNNPPTRGRVQWIKSFANHVFQGRQNVDQAGWQQSAPQQRTSIMRPLMPPIGIGYDPETATPNQLPQQPNTQKFLPVTGSDPYGTGVLNSDTYGAGQTAGGLGGNLYTPPSGPPPTNQTQPPDATGMPVWG